MKLRFLIVSLNLIAIKAGCARCPGPCDRRGVKTGPDGNCVDINECETDQHNCPSDHVCINLDASKSEGYFRCKPASLQTTSSSTTETTTHDDYSAMKTTANTMTANTTTANTTAANTTTANTTTKSIHNETETISQAKTTTTTANTTAANTTTANTTTKSIHNETETISQVETTTKGQSTTQTQMTTNAGITIKITVEIVALIVAVFLFY